MFAIIDIETCIGASYKKVNFYNIFGFPLKDANSKAEFFLFLFYLLYFFLIIKSIFLPNS